MTRQQSRHPDRLSAALAKIHDAAQQRGGACLSETYQGMLHHYRMRCSAGHEWLATGNNILSGRWCRLCFNLGTRATLDVARQLAQDKGGRCLSTEYTHAKASMQWSCARGHTWQARFTNIRQGAWCRQCYDLDRSMDPAKRAKYVAGVEN
jgi:hypothetical protein